MGFLSNLFSKKSVGVLGVDIGTSSIKIVQLARKGGKAILETYGELALGPYAGVEIGRATNLSPEKIAEALKDLLRESKATSVRSGMAIPFSSSLITMMDVPAVAEKQLAQIVPLEARKYIPVPISDVMLDWWVIPREAEKSLQYLDEEQKAKIGDKIDILLVAIHNDAVARNQTIVTQAGLDTSFFELEVFSTVRSVLDQDVQAHMIVDLGAASTKIYIVERNVIKTSHVINRGSQDITIALAKALGVPEQTAEIMKRDLSQVPQDKQNDVDQIISLTLDYIFSEAHRILLLYQKKYQRDVAQVALVGGGALLPGITTLAQANLQTEVILGNPFNKTEAPAFMNDALMATGPGFAVAVGIALRKLQETQ